MMNKFLLMAGLSFAVIFPAGAETRSGELLARLSEKVRSMKGYAVDFVVRTSDQTISGRYLVRGDAYSMTFGNAVVFGDGCARWEVDPDKREVVIDAVDLSSHNLLNNPTRAFDLANGEFVHELLDERNGKATIRLVPATPKAGITTVLLTLDTSTSLPVAVTYDLDDERVEISVVSFRPSVQAPASFRAADYPEYELIDFR